jgi:MYXO-CTERM domain-containing protein
VKVRPPALSDQHGEVAVPSDKYLTWISPDHHYLPKWKTEWERELERRAKTGAGGSPLLDQYDDYRNKYIDKFFVTKPPTTAGIRPPAEYEPSQAYLLAWAQYSQTAWKKLFGDIVKGAWGIVPVVLIYKDAAHQTYLETELKALGLSATEIKDPKNIIWWQQQTNAIWARDFGPVSIVTTPTSGSPTLSFVDFRYYHARQYDDEIPADLAKDWGINDFRPDLEYEGGNFMSTADGLCAATRGVLYYNLQYSQSAVEQIFADYLGCKETVFTATMQGGVIAHIDMFAKFASDTAMLVAEYQASQDATNKAILDANAKLFDGKTTPSGKTMTVTRIPMPDAGSGILKTWRTYTNSLSLLGTGGGKVVLIPVYSDETTYEKDALAAYAKVFPGWTLVPIDSKIIIPGQGAIHCITMQIPVGSKAKMETDPPDLCGATKFQCAERVCGNIGTQGCCDNELLKYCSKGKLRATECASKPKCGWSSSQNNYQCGTAGTPDPAGVFPLSCNVLNDAGVPEAGWPDMWVDPCGKIPYQGCCDGHKLRYCQGSQLKEVDCSGDPSCGWSPSLQGYECGTQGGEDPAGKYPKLCPGATPDIGVDLSPPDAGPDQQARDLEPSDQGAVDTGAGDGDSVDDDGCSCATAIPPRAGPPLLPLLGLLLLPLWRRRSR